MDPQELGTGAVLAVLVSEIIELAKRNPKFSWITIDTEMANRLFGGLLAFLTGLGLQFSFDPITGTLVVNGLLWGSITHGFAQWAAQQAYYRIAVKKGPSA